MSEFNELHASFTEHLKVKNYSPQSVAAYSGHLRLFLDHLTENGITDIKRVTRDVLKDYQQKIAELPGLKGTGYAVGTISMKVRAVKRFFEYLEDIGTILINPAEHIKEPKKETRLPRVVLSEDEVRKIFDQPNLSTLVGIRDRCVLEVFYSTGIRLEELTTLTIFDCDLQGGLLRVKGKFSKDRVVPSRQARGQVLKRVHHERPAPTHQKQQAAPDPLREPVGPGLVQAGGRAHGQTVRQTSEDRQASDPARLPSHLRNGPDQKRRGHHRRLEDARPR